MRDIAAVNLSGARFIKLFDRNKWGSIREDKLHGRNQNCKD